MDQSKYYVGQVRAHKSVRGGCIKRDLCWLQVLWDEEDPSLFVASNSRGQLHTYLLTQQSTSGQQLQLLATASLPVGHKPVLLADGRLSVRLKSGAVDTFVLETHKPLLEHSSDIKQLQRR